MSAPKNDPRLCSGTGLPPYRIVYESSSVGVCPDCRRVISFKAGGVMARHFPPNRVAPNTYRVQMEADFFKPPYRYDRADDTQETDCSATPHAEAKLREEGT